MTNSLPLFLELCAICAKFATALSKTTENQLSVKDFPYRLMFALWYAVSLLPWRVMYIISDFVFYPLVYHVLRYRRRLVRQSLSAAFPEKDAGERLKTEREFYHWFCDYIVEIIKHASMTVEDIDRHIELVGVEAVEREFMASGKSLCVLYLGHFNNWEWVSLLGAKFKPEFFRSQVYHPLHNKVLDRIFKRNRGKCGTQNVAMKETYRVIVNQMRAGRKIIMGFIADQRPKTIHHWMHWLHQDTPVITGAETIGQRVGAIYYYIDVRRERRGYYRATFERLPETGEGPFPITEHYMRKMEESIQADPAHWLWTHNRWKYKREASRAATSIAGLLLALSPLAAFGQTDSMQTLVEHDSCSAVFFREWLHTPDLVSYLQGVSPHTVVQGTHTGRWSEADGMVFSIDGQSYRQNRYYTDGMRTNLRLNSGMPAYVLNMEHYDLRIDPQRAALAFTLDTVQANYASLTGNFGNIGGINPTTEGIVHIFHGTGVEGLYTPITEHARQHIRAAGTVDVATNAGDYRQHLLLNIGSRRLVRFDANGQPDRHPLYDAPYFRLQLDGQLPALNGFDRTGYFAAVTGKADGFSEFGLNENEQPHSLTTTLTLYAGRNRRQGFLTTGLTWGMTRLQHDDIGFARNLADQDGEGLEPWMPDGSTHELSWALTGSRRINRWLTFDADCWNSLIIARPAQQSWSNLLYVQFIGDDAPTALYRYDWRSEAFAGALLENTLTLNARHHCNSWLTLKGTLGMSLDGMLLRDNSKVTPNLEAAIGLEARPWRWLDINLQLAHSRLTYDIETLRYMSTRYQNGKIYAVSAGDTRNPQQADYPTLLNTTGGKYHQYASRLWQPSYVELSIPIRARFGRHEILLHQMLRRYYHTWHTQYKGGASANGTWATAALTPEQADLWKAEAGEIPLFFPTPGTHNYEVGYLPSELMGNGILKSGPYYLTQLTQYAYHGKKVYFSLSWHSMIGATVAPMGNGPLANNVGSLSESTANPNTLMVLDDLSTPSQGMGRTDQDRAYIARIVLSWNATRHFSIGGTASWTDGQPIQFYHGYMNTDYSSASHRDMTVLPVSSRGINPTNGNFGCRESAIFHIDLHARLNWRAAGHDMTLTAQSYNVYDFGNVLNEFSFSQGYTDGRGDNLALTVPRGLLLTFSVGL